MKVYVAHIAIADKETLATTECMGVYKKKGDAVEALKKRAKELKDYLNYGEDIVAYETEDSINYTANNCEYALEGQVDLIEVKE